MTYRELLRERLPGLSDWNAERMVRRGCPFLLGGPSYSCPKSVKEQSAKTGKDVCTICWDREVEELQ